MIVINELEKRFENAAALQNVSLTVETGRIMGIVGSNGAGKSTLLRCLAGIYKAEAGVVTIDGIAPYENTEIKGRIFFAHCR